MEKNVIILVGDSGSGKTTLGEYLESNTEYLHFENDMLDIDSNYYQNKMLSNPNKSSKLMIIDALYEDTESLALSLDQYTNLNYRIDVIYLDIDEKILEKNIQNRKTKKVVNGIETDWETINVATNVNYDFDKLKESYKFSLSIIKDYFVVESNLPKNMEDIINRFFNTFTN